MNKNIAICCKNSNQSRACLEVIEANLPMVRWKTSGRRPTEALVIQGDAIFIINNNQLSWVRKRSDLSMIIDVYIGFDEIESVFNEVILPLPDEASLTKFLEA